MMRRTSPIGSYFLFCIRYLELETRLLFDTPERSNRDVLLRVRDGDAARLGWVFELDVAALLGDFRPTV
jgi:hypothetical protein